MKDALFNFSNGAALTLQHDQLFFLILLTLFTYIVKYIIIIMKTY